VPRGDREVLELNDPQQNFTERSERFEECKQLLFLRMCQTAESINRLRCLAGMPLDGILEGQEPQVMHESRARAQPTAAR
jgi:hypothetical protein